MEYPLSHAELLVMAIKSRVSVIHEFSGNTRYECRKLQRWAAKYAGIHNLELNYTDELFGIHYEDEERDVEIAERIDAEEQRMNTDVTPCPRCYRYLVDCVNNRFVCSSCKYSWSVNGKKQ
jgi:hypothetical protein